MHAELQPHQADPDTKLKLGLMVTLSENVSAAFEKVVSVGLETCQMQCWEPQILTPDLAK